MPHEPLELVRRFYELSRAGGWQQLELLSGDVVYRPIAEITEAGEYRGRDSFRRYMESFFDSGWAEGLEYPEPSLWVNGDSVIARIEFAGHGRTSGLDFTARVFVVHTVRHGKIVRVEDFIDRADALAAAGYEDGDVA